MNYNIWILKGGGGSLSGILNKQLNYGCYATMYQSWVIRSNISAYRLWSYDHVNMQNLIQEIISEMLKPDRVVYLDTDAAIWYMLLLTCRRLRLPVYAVPAFICFFKRNIASVLHTKQYILNDGRQWSRGHDHEWTLAGQATWSMDSTMNQTRQYNSSRDTMQNNSNVRRPLPTPPLGLQWHNDN